MYNLRQATAILVYRVQNNGDLPAYVKSLQNLVETYLPIHPDEYHVYKVKQAFREVCLRVRVRARVLW